MIDKPKVASNGFIETATGILAPPGYVSAREQMRDDHILQTYSGFSNEGFAYGLRLNRDPDTMVVKWARKGSGLDDRINQALADGTIANAGISPVVFPQLTALIKRRQSQVLTASLTVTGRRTPAKNARDAISRFNDSPLGAIDAVRQIMYHLDVYNRGAPISTCPIIYPTSQWAGYGMSLRSFGENGNKYWLEVDWGKHGTPIPFLPNVFDLEPTANAEFPYWYKTKVDDRESWVLLHETQILGLLPSWTGTPGIGTSAVYACLGFIGEHVLVVDERYEKMIDNPSDGLLIVHGVPQSAETIKRKLQSSDSDDMIESGSPSSRGWTVMATPTSGAGVEHFSFRQKDGVDFKLRREYFEDILALAFEETLSSIVIRGGVGYGVQSGTASDNVADSGVFAVLQGISVALSKIYPRLSITIGKTNDRARSLSLGLLNQFSSAMASLPDGTLSPLEMRAIINRDVLTIPIIDDSSIIAEAANEDDAGEIESIGDESQKDGTAQEGKDASGNSSVGKVAPAKQKKASALDVVLNWKYHLTAIQPAGADEDLTQATPDPQSVKPLTFYQDYPEYDGVLDAEFDEDSTEVTDPDARKPNNKWLWIALLLLYERERDATVLERDDTLTIRDDLAELRALRSGEFARLVGSQKMTVRQWQRQMERIIQESIAQEYWLGRGGRKAMSQDDWDWLNGYIDKQFGEIAYLASQLSLGMYSEAQLSNHSANLTRRARAGYEAGNAMAHGISIGSLPAVPGDGSTRCLGSCHCYWEHHIDSDGEWVGSSWRHPPISQPKRGWEPCFDCDYRLTAWSPWFPGTAGLE